MDTVLSLDDWNLPPVKDYCSTNSCLRWVQSDIRDFLLQQAYTNPVQNMRSTILVATLLLASLCVATGTVKIADDVKSKIVKSGVNASAGCGSAYSWALANHNEKSWCGLCLGFCRASWNHAGYDPSYLNAASAKDAVGIAKQHSGWHDWSGNSHPPKGALVLFYNCNAPTNPYGHACLSAGGGSGLSDCVQNPMPWSWYRTNYCGEDPAGWIIPSGRC